MPDQTRAPEHPRVSSGGDPAETSRITTVSVVDADGKVLVPGRGLDQLLGVPTDAREGQSIFELVHPDDRSTAFAAFSRVVKGEVLRAGAVIRILRPDGVERTLDAQLIDHRDDQTINGFLLTSTDITEHVTTSRALHAAREEASLRLQTLLSWSSELVILTDDVSTFTYVSPASTRLLGLAPEELLGTRIIDRAHPDDRSVILTPFEPGVPTGPLHVRMRHADGEFRTLEGFVTDLRHEPLIGGILINARDITAERAAEEARQRSVMLDASVREISTRIASSTVDTTEKLLREALHSLREVTGATRAGILVRRRTEPCLVETYDAVGPVSESLIGKSRPLSLEMLDALCPRVLAGEVFVTYRSDDDTRLIDEVEIAGYEPILGMAYVPLFAAEELLGLMVLTSSDADWRCAEDMVASLQTVGEICGGALARQRAEEQLSDRALHDPLTGLPNRRLLTERLDHALRRSERATNWVALLFVDVDHFKDVNDTLGHEVGDALLVLLSRRLEEFCRAGDTVARFGGDEFVVLMESDEPESAVEILASRLMDILSAPYDLGDRSVQVGVSVGVALQQQGDASSDASALLRRADTAMYRAKEAGRNKVMLFASDMEEHARQRFELVADLRRAVRDLKQFEVWFQPIFALPSVAPAGFEALVRWCHPTQGLLLPGAFIDAAEETNQIVVLGMHVLERAIEHLVVTDDGSAASSVGVNVSIRQLLAKGFVENVASVLRNGKVCANRLVIELTESLFAHRDEVMGPLLALRSLGVRVGIDDFGTGYSSLAYLRDLPVDVLKVDRSFVSRIGESPRDDAVLRAVFSLAQNLELETVAEGVESQDQLDALIGIGCTFAQGYLLGHPKPADAQHARSR